MRKAGEDYMKSFFELIKNQMNWVKNMLKNLELQTYNRLKQ